MFIATTLLNKLLNQLDKIYQGLDTTMCQLDFICKTASGLDLSQDYSLSTHIFRQNKNFYCFVLFTMS